jgi:hypothetical protein
MGFFKKLGNLCKNIGEGIKDVAGDVVEGVKDVADDVGDGLKDVGKEIKDGMNTLADVSLEDIGNKLGDIVKDAGKAVVEGVVEGAHKFKDGAIDIGKGLASGDMKQVLNGFGEMGEGAFSFTPLAVASDAASGATGMDFDKMLADTGKSVVKGVVDSVLAVKDGVGDVGMGLLTGDMKRVAGGLLEAAGGAVSLMPTQIVAGAAATAVGNVVSEVIPGKLGDMLGDAASFVGNKGSAVRNAVDAGKEAVTTAVKEKVVNEVMDKIPDHVKDQVKSVSGDVVEKVGGAAGKVLEKTAGAGQYVLPAAGVIGTVAAVGGAAGLVAMGSGAGGPKGKLSESKPGEPETREPKHQPKMPKPEGAVV